MKYLKWILILLLLLLLVFIGRGLLTPSISYESEITVDKPAAEAWAVMSDESKISLWLESIKKMEPVSGTPNTVGAKSKIYIEENGSEMVMEETITTYDPHDKIAMTFTMDFMDMDYEMHFDEKDGKTTIKSNSTVKGNGIIAKSMVAFMKGAMKSQEDENMTRLKKVIEENTTNYFPEPVDESEEGMEEDVEAEVDTEEG